ncbi:sigma-54-dependent Fis family transcriptional regulator [Desnuesiella massiliensis]|uniref:sigma-54-dependent Fis family transcriptional regulator n=1 Tax=Desnuesiella massiliensis TaxID=1650662 RepID=UPI0006E21B65|nr:sigma 54-interacting transcriptional regulator [Desnuesiella massiliensis]
METSLLKEIQDIVIKYANVISSVINVDVEIVDENLLRVAGTGIYKDKLNESIAKKDSVYSYVLSCGESQIIENPRSHSLCFNCSCKEKCEEKMEICTPIKLDNKNIGVIGLICSSEEQKIYLKEKLNSYMDFLIQIAEFISIKSNEHLESKKNKGNIDVFKQVIDSIGRGVVVVNRSNRVVHINKIAERYLKVSRLEITYPLDIILLGDCGDGEEIYNLKLQNKKVKVKGKQIPVFPHIADYDKIIVFDEYNDPKNQCPLKVDWKAVRLENVIGKSSPMILLKEKIKKISTSKSTILITGESGTGKELMARAIHSESNRWNRPFIAINCGAIPDALLESELFGYVRGAFSGADPNGRVGKFELANGGTIFLDEIGDMPLNLQVKLLRVLQERKFARIGSNQLMDIDIKVIAATNKDLKKLIEENKFREDLYYRLNVIPLEVPSLRERKEDIEEIALSMIEKYNDIFGKTILVIEEECKNILINYPWPGNVRELENTLEFMINMSEDSFVLTKEMLPNAIKNYEDSKKISSDLNYIIKPLKEIEEDYIRKALDMYGRDTKGKQMAAKKLGIGIATLYRKLEHIN